MAPGQTRPVKLVADPDLCSPAKVVFTVKSQAVRTASEASLGLRHPSVEIRIEGVAAGQHSLVARVSKPSSSDPNVAEVAELELPIDVREATVPTCTPGQGRGQATLGPQATKVSGTGALAQTSLSTSTVAFSRTDEFALTAFGASVACAQTGDFTK